MVKEQRMGQRLIEKQTGVAVALSGLLVETVKSQQIVVVGLLAKTLDLVRSLLEFGFHCVCQRKKGREKKKKVNQSKKEESVDVMSHVEHHNVFVLVVLLTATSSVVVLCFPCTSQTKNVQRK